MHSKENLLELLTILVEIDSDNKQLNKLYTSFNKIMIDKLMDRYRNYAKDKENQLVKMDETLFETPFYALPTIDISEFYQKANILQKKNIFTYLNKLYEDDIDPFIGVGSNNVGVMDMFQNIPDMKPDEEREIGSTIGDMIQEKMGDFSKEDIEEASKMAEKIFSTGDQKTSLFMKDLITSITSEMENIKANGKNPMKNIMQIAQKVTEQIKPRALEENIDFDNIMNTTKNNASELLKQADPTGCLVKNNMDILAKFDKSGELKKIFADGLSKEALD